jgi:predicted dehydrogenase
VARRTIVIGMGVVAQFWLPALRARDDVELVALVDPDETRAAETAAAHGVPAPVFGALDEALGATGPDLAVVLTPPALHRPVCERVLAAGCDVFCEKPLADTVPDARAIVDAAAAAGRVLSVMQNRRHQPAIARLREGIASGAIGELVQLCADMFMAPSRTVAHLVDEPHPLLLDMGIHTFDQARFLAAADPVAAVCHELHPPQSLYAGAAAAVCTFELDDGSVFSYRGSWVAHGFETSYDSAWRLVGTDGTAVWDSVGTPGRSTGDGSREDWPAEPPRDTTGHAAAIDVLLDALAAGRPAPTDGADNLKSLAMVLAAIRSSAEQRRVTIAEVLAG